MFKFNNLKLTASVHACYLFTACDWEVGGEVNFFITFKLSCF